MTPANSGAAARRRGTSVVLIYELDRPAACCLAARTEPAALPKPGIEGGQIAKAMASGTCPASCPFR